VQKAKAEDGAVIMNQKSCRSKAKQAQTLEEEQHRKFANKAPTKPSDKESAAATIQSARKYRHREGAVEAKKVNAQTVVENSVGANSSVPQTFTHTECETEAVPKGRAEKTDKKRKEGKDVAVQKAKAEDGAVIMNQKSCRNKAKQAQKLEEEQQQKLANKAPTKPSDKEGAAATIQSARKYRHREGAVEAKKVKVQIVVENSVEANSSVPQTFTHTGGEKETIPKGRTEKTDKKKKEGKDDAVYRIPNGPKRRTGP